MMMMMVFSWVFPGFYSADTRLKEHRDAMAVVNFEGNVLWLPAAIFRSTCPVNILYFPFDIQVCILKFGSWTYDGWKLDVNFHEDVGEVVSNTGLTTANGGTFTSSSVVLSSQSRYRSLDQ